MEAHLVVEKIQNLAPIAIPFFALIANLIPAIPEELFVIAVGYASASGVLPLWLALVLVVPPLALSDNALYWLSRAGNKQIHFVARKIFGSLLDKPRELSSTSQEIILFVSRFIFQARFLGPFLCGISKMPYRRFVLIDSIAVFLYVALMYAIGYFLRAQYATIDEGASIVMGIITTMAGVVIASIVIFSLRKRLINWTKMLLAGNFSFLGIEYTPPTEDSSDIDTSQKV